MRIYFKKDRLFAQPQLKKMLKNKKNLLYNQLNKAFDFTCRLELKDVKKYPI